MPHEKLDLRPRKSALMYCNPALAFLQDCVAHPQTREQEWGQEWGQSSLLTLPRHEHVPDNLPQDFAKFFSSGRPVARCGAGDADEVKR